MASTNMTPIVLGPKVHAKGWGSELWICNNDEFCGKLLSFGKGKQCSAHQHKNKREVFYVLEGKLELMTIDPVTAKQTLRRLTVGDTIEIPRMLVHQLTALEDSEIIEFSTHHEDDDSYRVLPGDGQK